MYIYRERERLYFMPTASAVGPGAARRGAWGAHTVRATAAAVGPGAIRGAWGGHGLGEGCDIYIYIYIYI